MDSTAWTASETLERTIETLGRLAGGEASRVREHRPTRATGT
jgi:hypothetical protein